MVRVGTLVLLLILGEMLSKIETFILKPWKEIKPPKSVQVKLKDLLASYTF